jgi:acetyltransferase-like isoleucine patch superfamily enzyme
MNKIIKAIEELIKFPLHILAMLIIYLPGTSGCILRNIYWRRRLACMGKNVNIDRGVLISNPNMIKIGNNVHIKPYSILIAGPSLKEGRIRRIKNKNFSGKPGEMIIGNNVEIGQYSYILALAGVEMNDGSAMGLRSTIYSWSSYYLNPKDKSEIVCGSDQADLKKQYMIAGPVVFEENSACYGGCVILPGVTLKKHSVVMPLSKISLTTEENCIYEGIKGEKVGKRFTFNDEDS